MRFGAIQRLTVFASLSLLVSGQLCMLTTCAPRLRELSRGPAHACCATASTERSAPSSGGVPSGAMPCAQKSSLADAPALSAPEPHAVAPAFAAPDAPARLAAPVAVELDRERPIGPRPGRGGPAPAGLRAPPIA